MMTKMIMSAAAALAFSLASHAAAVPLVPGDSFLNDDDGGGGSAGVTLLTHPEFDGVPLATLSATASRVEAGFDGVEVIDDLYQVSATITQDVLQGPDGVIFATNFNVDTGFSPGPGNGAITFSLDGYAGWDVDIEYLSDDAPLPFFVERSGDGDTLTFTFIELVFFDAGTFFISTNAETFASNGGGDVDVLVDTFGDEQIAVGGLAAPTAVPLPATVYMLIGALGLLAFNRSHWG